jgi:hypothetical protein
MPEHPESLRFFKERGVPVQFRDINEKAPSPGELERYREGRRRFFRIDGP